MNLLLLRETLTDKSTGGRILVDGEFQCFTLEDVDRKLEHGGLKVYGKTCIPRGKYQIVMDWSPHFQREVPHLLKVPMFDGVRIHPGNSAEDTDGCILVGTERVPDYIRNSKIAFDALVSKMNEAWKRGEEVWIEIV